MTQIKSKFYISRHLLAPLHHFSEELLWLEMLAGGLLECRSLRISLPYNLKTMWK